MSQGVRLTDRDRRVLNLVLRGLTNKQIGASLGVTEQAIKEHVSSLLVKFGVPNRAALAEAGARLELAGEPGLDRAWVRELFLEAQPQICVLRGPELRYEAVNHAFAVATGNRQAVGRTMRETFPELEGQGIFERVERVYASGSPLIEHEVSRQWDRGKGVERRVIDLVLQPLHADDGSVNGVISFAVDVTELVAERRRSIVSEELATLIDLVPQGVLVFDRGGSLVKWNTAASSVLPTLTARDAAGVVLCDDAGRALRLADIESSAEPRAYSLRHHSLVERFEATARVMRGSDREASGAILILTS